MKKVAVVLISIFVFHLSINAQSVINKFLEQNFILSDSIKTAEGNCYAAEAYRFEKGKILLIATQGNFNNNPISTGVVVRGINENNEVVLPEIKYHSDFNSKTENIFLFTTTGIYTIYFFNRKLNEKGEITNNMGLGLTSWIDSGQVFRSGNKTDFALALGKVLGHAIFQFNLMSGETQGHNHKPLITLPGADVADKNGICFGQEHLDKNLQTHKSMYSCDYFLGEAKFPKILQEGGYEYPDFEKNYNFKDSVAITNQYGKYKKMVTEALGSDFQIEAEAVNKISNGKEGEFASGRMIVFKYKQSRPILDSSDTNKYSFMFQNDIRVSLSLVCHTNNYNNEIQAKLLLSVYSY